MKKITINKKSLIWKIALVILFVLLDLVTKNFFMQYFASGNSEISILSGFLTFTYYENSGAAFGSFSDSTVMLTIISIVFVIVFIIIDLFQNDNSKLYITSFSLIIAGAVGNMIDRIALHYVRDFIKLSIFNFVFNIADACICIGVFLYILNVIISEFRKTKGEKNID